MFMSRVKEFKELSKKLKSIKDEIALAPKFGL